SSRRRHTRFSRDWSSDVCSSDLKTTLVSILGGSKSPTSGTITIDGAPVKLTSAGDALRKGIAHVSQEGSLVPGLTGAENILLGRSEERRVGNECGSGLAVLVARG